MKKIILLFLFFLATKTFAQTNGITYQAVILNPTVGQTANSNSNTPLVYKDVCLLFKFYDEFSKLEYQEVIQTKTDQYGMVNLIIGTGLQTDGYATSFETISWDSMKKSLEVGVSTSGSCAAFTEISNQPFTNVPFAYSATNATTITGIVSIENGGTNATSLLEAKKNLGIENIDNTSDLNKPVSSATKTELDSKEISSNKSSDVIFDGDSNTKYPTVKAVKTYFETGISSSNTALQSEISRATAAEGILTSGLTSETAARTSADATLTSGLISETTRATTAESVLATDLASEATARANADTTLASDVDSNKTASDLADTALQTNINTVQTTVASNKAATDTAIAGVQSDVDANKASSDLADTALQTNIDSNKTLTYTAIAGVQSDVDSNKTASDLADTALQTNINTVQTTVDSNKAATDTAIAGVQSDVDSNKTATDAAIAVVQSDVDSNKTASDLIDTALQTNIDIVQSDVDANETASQAALNLKANLESPTLEGTPLAPTAAAGTNTTQIATTEFVTAAALAAGANLVDLTSDQTIAGTKTFSSDLTANGLTVGRGAGDVSSNTAVGYQTLKSNTTGSSNTAIGAAAIDGNTTGSNNVVLGAYAGSFIADGSTSNTLIDNSVLIGSQSKPLAAGDTNEIVIGYNAVGNGSNTIQLGNSAVTNVNTHGSITANAEISSEIISDFTIDNSNAEQFKGKVLICNPNVQITITFGNSLPLGFNCMVLQKSNDDNKINFVGGSGVTMKNRNNFTATAGNYAIATIVNIGGGIIVTAGDMQ